MVRLLAFLRLVAVSPGCPHPLIRFLRFLSFQHLSSQRHLHLEAGIPYVSRKDARKFAPYPRNKTSFAQDKGPDSDASWKEAAEKLQSEISFTPASSSTTTSQEKQPQQQTVRISRPSLRDSFVKGPVMK